MNNVIEFNDEDKINEEAAQWVIALEQQELSVSQREEIFNWLKKSKEHRQALLLAVEVWGDSDVLSQLSDVFPLDDFYRGSRFSRLRNHWLYIGSAFSTAVVVMLFAWYINVFNSAPQKIFVTPVGEVKNLKMSDGSEITLNTNTSIEENYNNKVRMVKLNKGEAYFNVAHNKTKPFVVMVGNQKIEAIGTAFSVYERNGNFDVMVTDGKVRVTQKNSKLSKDPIIHFVSKGEAIQVDTENKGLVRKLESDQLAQVFMWQKQMLGFHGDSLRKVVDEFSRYTKTKIIIEDDGTADIRVGGYFSTNDVEGLLLALDKNFGIEVSQLDKYTYKLSMR